MTGQTAPADPRPEGVAAALTVEPLIHVGCVRLRDERGAVIAVIFERREGWAAALATAHRFAAAGALEAALRWAVEWMERYEGETMPDWREWAIRGRAALAAAALPDEGADRG